ECGVREEVPREVRQGSLLLLGDQLHDRFDDPRGDEEDRRQVAGPRGRFLGPRPYLFPKGSSVTQDARTSAQEPVLELKGLCKSFGGLQAVRGVDLKISAGDRKAIIGPNGAGKTTLFNVVTGLLSATAGQVLLFGQDVTRWPSYRRTALGMARTFQVTSLFP